MSRFQNNLPKAPSSHGSRGRSVALGDILSPAGLAAPVQPCAAAREEDDYGGQQAADGGDEGGPGCRTPLGAAAVVGVVDLGLDDAEADEVGD